MTTSRLNWIQCTIITIILQMSLEAMSDSPPSDSGQLMEGQQHQLMMQPPPRMSCYVCSTMDYSDTAENLCRVMKHHYRPTSGLHQQSNSMNADYHPTYMRSYPQTTTTTTTTSSSNFMPSMEALTSLSSSPSNHDESQTDLSNLRARNMSMEQYHNDKLVNSNDTIINNPSSYVPTYHGHNPHRNTPPNNYIRTRQCLDDENFCSIVSVVRIEFSNDNISTKFWALERNCSKSCNTGCMIIGERVRLKVCSQCCRKSNCNIGSGATRMLITVWNEIFILLLSLIIMGKILFIQSPH